MNDAAQVELKIIVERAVRPVRASVARKRPMREELLSHLVSIFEEEAVKLGDERGALERARERFGDPRELSRQLQETVPAWDHIRSLLERLRLEPGESLLHFAGKVALVSLASYLVAAVLVIPRLLAVGRGMEVGMALRVLLVVGAVSTVFTFVMAVVGVRMSLALHGRDSERSLRKVALYGLATLAVFPVLTFAVYWSLPLDTSLRLFYLRLSCYLAPAAPVLFAVMSRREAETRRYEDEWSSLRIVE